MDGHSVSAGALPVRLTGHTYPVRNELRALGATWDAEKGCWYVPDDRAEEARGLLEVGQARHNAGKRGKS